MTQEEKQLLLKDLCGRLPYFVEAQVVNTIEGESKPLTISKELTFSDVESFANCGVVCNIKPYLRPMSSMTEEEKEEYRNECNKVLSMPFKVNGPYPIVDWLNAHHFDHRGLIPMGLALEAPEDMYK